VNDSPDTEMLARIGGGEQRVLQKYEGLMHLKNTQYAIQKYTTVHR
jgi:hypothetical protein